MLALQALCVFDALGEMSFDSLTAFLHDPQTRLDLGLRRPVPAKVLDFARRLVQGTWQHRAGCDKRLTETSSGWSIARMPPVDRNILRLGVYELLEEADTPPEVIINEAVELARLFADRDSPGFVNGVLDAVRRGLQSAGEQT